jgi:hypothetical protein
VIFGVGFATTGSRHRQTLLASRTTICDRRLVKPLDLPDIHHLRAAQGWLELGNHLEANEELEKIAPALRAHPSVLLQSGAGTVFR